MSLALSPHSENLILRHILGHIQNAYDFLRQLRYVNGFSRLICSKTTWFD